MQRYDLFFIYANFFNIKTKNFNIFAKKEANIFQNAQSMN